MSEDIRMARPEDAAELAELSRQLGYPSTAEETASRLERLLGVEDHLVLVVVGPGEKVLGWIHAFAAHRLESESFAEIGGLVVHEGFRSQGIGARLVAAVEGWARERGIATLRVRSRTTRPRAHAFYEGLGFAATKDQRVLDKPLEPPLGGGRSHSKRRRAQLSFVLPRKKGMGS
ncbi:MAG: GNAT family N-acetyltransferase [Acidobacteria bacterium]|nr:GNAT family N-acetyltransferase [Acidobacteriota bacterium]